MKKKIDEKTKKLTVVVPVYNVQNYLIECVNSIMKQTYNNLEIIIIDDGSTDKSGKICDRLAKKDCRIKVIHKKNEGVSKSRNLGIKLSTGELITFIDADDFLEKNMFENMINLYTDGYLVACTYNVIENNKIKKNHRKKSLCEDKFVEDITVHDALTFLANRKKIYGFTWNKIFSTEIIKQNKLKFIDSISICEDLCFVAEYILYVKGIKYIHDNLYNYRLREDSASFSKNNLKKRITILEAYNYLIQLYNENKIDTTYLEYWILREAMYIKEKYINSNTDDSYKKYCKKIIDTKFYKLIKNKNLNVKDKIRIIIHMFLSKLKY